MLSGLTEGVEEVNGLSIGLWEWLKLPDWGLLVLGFEAYRERRG
jgi:hypothetical protein